MDANATAAPSPGTNRRARLAWALGTVALAVLAARLVALALTRSVEYDEAISLLVARDVPVPIWPDGVVTAGEAKQAMAGRLPDPFSQALDLRHQDVHPPLYFWLLSVWVAVAGDSVLALRLPTMLCALASAVPLLAIGRILLGRTLAPLILLPLAASPLLPEIGATARPYGLGALLVLTALWGALALAQAARRAGGRLPLGAMVALGFGAGLAAWTNHLAAMLMPILFVWVLLVLPGRRRARYWLPFVIALCFGLAWLVFVLGQLGNRPDQAAGTLSPLLMVLTLIQRLQALSLGAMPPLAPPWHQLQRLAMCLLAIIFVVIGYAILARRWMLPARSWTLVYLLAVGAWLAPVALGLVSGKILLQVRYFATVGVLASVVLLGAVVRLFAARIGALACALLALSGAQLLLGHLMAVRGLTQAEPWASVAEIVQARDVELVLIDQGYGRGVPAAMLLTLPASQPVQILAADGCPVAEPAPRRVALVLSLREASRERLAAACDDRLGEHRVSSAVKASLVGDRDTLGSAVILFTRP